MLQLEKKNHHFAIFNLPQEFMPLFNHHTEFKPEFMLCNDTQTEVSPLFSALRIL